VLPIRELDASSFLQVGHHRFPASSLVDGSTSETDYDYWLLRDRSTGSVRIRFPYPCRVRTVRFLNTTGGEFAPRSTERYQVVVYDTRNRPYPVAAGHAEPYPAWTELTLSEELSELDLTAIAITVTSFRGAGGGLNEIEISGSPSNPYHRINQAVAASFLALMLLVISVRSLPVRLRGPAGGLFLGVAVFFLMIGLPTLLPSYTDWIFIDRRDWTHMHLAWDFFRRDDWRFPLGAFENYLWPVGTSLGAAEALPLVPLLLKPVSGLLASEFQWLGGWYLGCFAAQGVAAALLARTFSPSPIVQVLSAAFFVLAPTNLNRFGHVALFAHWLILFELWLFCRPIDARTWSRQLFGHAVIALLASLIHPYLAMMVLAGVVADQARTAWVDREVRPALAAGGAALCIALVLVSFYALGGYFVVGLEDRLDPAGLAAYTHHATNLVAPVNPVANWSRYIRPLETGTQNPFEGFNYLGTGALLLLAFATYSLVATRPTYESLRRYLPLIIAFGAMAVFSLGNRITLGDRVLLEYPLIAPHTVLAKSFRASGRLFWPLGYLILFVLLRALYNRLDRRKFTALVSLALAVQLYDMRYKFAELWPYKGRPVRSEATFSPAWDVLTDRFERIETIPPVMSIELGRLASSRGFGLNAGWVPLQDADARTQYEQRVLEELLAGRFEPESIYVIIRPGLIRELRRTYEDTGAIIEVDGLHVLFPDWRRVVGVFSPAVEGAPPASSERAEGRERPSTGDV